MQYMKPFPASSAILSSIHLTQFVRDTYNFSNAITCRLLKAGINHTYLIEDGAAKYIFRIYSLNWRTVEEISEEIRLLNYLHSNNVPVSFAISDKQGKYIHEIAAPEGIRYAVLFSHAGGRKMIELTNEMHYKIGEIMARFHSLTENYPLQRITYTPEVLVIHPLEYIKQYLPADTEAMKQLLLMQEYLINALQKIDVTKIRSGVVHLDIWFDNLSINTKGDITLFDFDFCGNGWVSIDIAYHLMQLYFLEPDKQAHDAKRESFLSGYQSVAQITDEEKRILHVLATSLYFYYLGVQCSRFENWSNVFINVVYLSRYIMLRVKKQFELIGNT